MSMGGGKGAQRRATLKYHARRNAARKAAKEQKESVRTLTIPSITEDDLLAFQITHFGDDCQPSEWFIDAETALNYDPCDEEEGSDHGLGYYEDGVKRTLTDAQVEMFRHSEMEMIARQEKAQADQTIEEKAPETVVGDYKGHEAGSPASDASSVEAELVALAEPRTIAPSEETQRQQHRSQTISKHISTDPKTRRRAREVPYDQRHKRKWEAYIDENDPIEGSLTHRRIVRELDEQHTETVDLDY